VMSFQEIKTDNIDLMTINQHPYVPFGAVGNGVLYEHGGIVDAIPDGAPNQMLTTDGVNNLTWRQLGTGTGLLYSTINAGVASTTSRVNGTTNQVLMMNNINPPAPIFATLTAAQLPLYTVPVSQDLGAIAIHESDTLLSLGTISVKATRIGNIVTLFFGQTRTSRVLSTQQTQIHSAINVIPPNFFPYSPNNTPTLHQMTLSGSNNDTWAGYYTIGFLNVNNSFQIYGNVEGITEGLGISGQFADIGQQNFTFYAANPV